MKTDEPLFRVAAGQHGLLTRSQARDCGFGTKAIDRRIRSGRPRLQAIRDYLDPRGPNYRPAESNLELRVNSILKQDGQKPLVHQADVGDEDEWIGRVDLLDRELRVIVEVDSELYHGSSLDRQRDAERVARLEAAGFTVVQVREHDVWHNPGVVVAQIRAARRLARLLKAS